MRTPRAAALPLLALLGASCASTPRAPTLELTSYQRLYLTTPSHADGFAMSGASDAALVGGTASASSVEAVRRAVAALRHELIEEGFEVVDEDGEADGVLELTISGIGADGEAERAFVALRDAGSGHLVAVFSAHDRMGGRRTPTVEKLLEPLVAAIGEMVRATDPSGSH